MRTRVRCDECRQSHRSHRCHNIATITGLALRPRRFVTTPTAQRVNGTRVNAEPADDNGFLDGTAYLILIARPVAASQAGPGSTRTPDGRSCCEALWQDDGGTPLGSAQR